MVARGGRREAGTEGLRAQKCSDKVREQGRIKGGKKMKGDGGGMIRI